MGNEYVIGIGNRVIPIYVAQASSQGNPGGQSVPAVPVVVESKAPGPISPISPSDIPALKSVVRRDIELIDDMMLAEQRLAIGHMIELSNKGGLKNDRIDADPAPDGSLTAMAGKNQRLANKVKELAANGPLTKKVFSTASNYYFGSVYSMLDRVSPRDLLKKLDELKAKLGDLAGQLPTDVEDADFEKKYVAALIKIYNDPALSQYKSTALKMMVTLEILVFRNMVEITMAGLLLKGWKGGASVDEAALGKITCSRVASKIKDKAGTAPLTKKAFGDASNDYFGNVLYRVEQVVNDSDVVGELENQLDDFRGIPDQGLKSLLLAEDSKLLKGLKLDQVPDKPIAVLTAASSQGTAFEEQYGRGLIVLSKWLKDFEVQLLNAPPAPVAQTPEPKPEIPVKARTVQAEFTVTTRADNKGFDPEVEYNLSFPYPYLELMSHVNPFSSGAKLGVSKSLFDRLDLKASYGISREEKIINRDIVDTKVMQTSSGALGVKISEQFYLKINASLLWQGYNQFTEIESDEEIGLDFSRPFGSRDLTLNLGYGHARLASSLFSSPEEKLSPQFLDMNASFEPKEKGIYAKAGGRVIVNNNRLSSYPYTFVEPFQHMAYIEGGIKGLMTEEDKLGLRVNYGSHSYGAQISYNWAISNGTYTKTSARKVIEAKPAAIDNKANEAKPAEETKRAKAEKAIDPKKPLTKRQAKKLGLLSLLRTERGEDPNKDMSDDDFTKAVLDHHVYMALALLGLQSQPGKICLTSNEITNSDDVFKKWLDGIKDIAEADGLKIKQAIAAQKASSGEGPKPALPRFNDLELPKYLDMKEFFGADWEIVKTDKIEDIRYSVLLRRYSDWALGRKQETELLKKAYMADERRLLNSAWTENVGTSSAAGLMRENVIVSGIGSDQVKMNDNTYKNLIGEIDVNYDPTTKTGTIIPKGRTKQ